MDDNKLKLLREVGYTIPETCGLCEHGRFPSPTQWGTCSAREYEHKKHGDLRQMSIYRGGSCPEFELRGSDSGLFVELGGFLEFLRP